MSNPLCSILIRAKNEETLIEETLNSIFRQKSPSFEVILVDSGSTDDTLKIARKFDVHIIEIKPEDFTFGSALNIAAREAKGKYLVSLSAHSPPCSDFWLEELIKPFQNDPDCVGVYGRQLGDREINPFEACSLDYGYGELEKSESSPLMFSNANSAVTRDQWEQLPFDEKISGSEDYLWAKNMKSHGFNIHYAPNAAVWHMHDENFAQRVHRIFRENIAIFEVEHPLPRSISIFQILWEHILMPARILYFMITRRIGVRWLNTGIIFFYAFWFGNHKALKYFFDNKKSESAQS